VHDHGCWDRLAITETRPGTHTLAVDLPGRGTHPEWANSVDELVASVMADIDHAGYDRVLLVGHSMAGITIGGSPPRSARHAPSA
jgi:pimeloyl-ACP methyl ester carboxylesterase